MSSTILADLDGASGLLWNWSQDYPRDKIAALSIIRSLEKRGLPVFPSSNTCWHFDDKIAQKYLLESIDAPLVKTYVFYDLKTCLEWIAATTFPKVMKLRCGAGSLAVRLVTARSEAENLCRKAFRTGFSSTPSYFHDAKTKIHGIHRWPELAVKIRRFPRLLIENEMRRVFGSRERDYIYFQDFVPDNPFDTRVTIIGDRAFGFRRFVRPHDFRASGSGHIDFDPSGVGTDLVQTAYHVTRRIGAQSLAFDFVRDDRGNGLILEISYSYLDLAIARCSGFWDPDLRWISGNFWPQDLIMEDFLNAIQRQNGDSFESSIHSGHTCRGEQ